MILVGTDDDMGDVVHRCFSRLEVGFFLLRGGCSEVHDGCRNYCLHFTEPVHRVAADWADHRFGPKLNHSGDVHTEYHPAR